MKHLRRAGITIVVAIFSAGLVSVSAPAASADEGASAATSSTTTYTSNRRRDTSWT